MRFAELEAVTVDGYGTLLRLVEPVAGLRRALGRHGIARAGEEVEAAFRAEVMHYRPRAHLAADTPSLRALRLECVRIFLDALGEPLAAEAFVDDFIGALVFEAVPGARETVEALRARGLPLAVVANWDCGLDGHLERAGLAGCFETVVTSARAGVPKPDPAIFRLALRELGAAPERAVHVGDEAVDEVGALAAGMRFLPAPLATAFQGWT